MTEIRSEEIDGIRRSLKRLKEETFISFANRMKRIDGGGNIVINPHFTGISDGWAPDLPPKEIVIIDQVMDLFHYLGVRKRFELLPYALKNYFHISSVDFSQMIDVILNNKDNQKFKEWQENNRLNANDQSDSNIIDKINNPDVYLIYFHLIGLYEAFDRGGRVSLGEILGLESLMHISRANWAMCCQYLLDCFFIHYAFGLIEVTPEGLSVEHFNGTEQIFVADLFLLHSLLEKHIEPEIFEKLVNIFSGAPHTLTSIKEKERAMRKVVINMYVKSVTEKPDRKKHSAPQIRKLLKPTIEATNEARAFKKRSKNTNSVLTDRFIDNVIQKYRQWLKDPTKTGSINADGEYIKCT